jgi:hypothetical protein
MSELAVYTSSALAAAVCVYFLYATLHGIWKVGQQTTEAGPGELATVPRRGPGPAVTHGEMQSDHRVEKSEHAGWLAEIAAWRSEHDEMLPILPRLEAAIHRWNQVLEDHAEAIRRHQGVIVRHERAIEEHRDSGAGDKHGRLATGHELFEKQHAEARQLHRRLRESHRCVSKGLEDLLEVVEAV